MDVLKIKKNTYFSMVRSLWNRHTLVLYGIRIGKVILIN